MLGEGATEPDPLAATELGGLEGEGPAGGQWDLTTRLIRAGLMRNVQ